MPELVREAQDGYLLPPGDPAALASAMSRLTFASADERREMGNHGRARMQEMFDLERVMERWSQLVEDWVRSRIQG
jgi:glycosyltransferase involved in cell wall biosynthesis